jgi:riboflavin synthase alpha subunit
MVRGYIALIGTLIDVGARGIAIRAPKVCESLAVGDSISVAGVCLSAYL